MSRASEYAIATKQAEVITAAHKVPDLKIDGEMVAYITEDGTLWIQKREWPADELKRLVTYIAECCDAEGHDGH